MADSFTPSLNLRKPEVGAAHDTWGGLTGLNGDLDLIDAVFLATGLGTSVGIHVGTGKVANIEGTLLVADSTDTTAGFMFDASEITTATIRTLKAPDADGTIALKSDVAATGDVRQGIWPVAPPGYVLADGRTIGSASSGATNRANADCEALFILLWTVMPTLPIYTFEGVASTRGANAAADFAANKRLTMFDARGRLLAGLDNMGGTAAGILTSATMTPNGTTMGATGGTQTHVLTTAQMPSHGHGGDGGYAFLYANAGAEFGFIGGAGNYAGYSYSTGPAGSSAAHPNTQPTILLNVAVKL